MMSDMSEYAQRPSVAPPKQPVHYGSWEAGIVRAGLLHMMFDNRVLLELDRANSKVFFRGLKDGWKAEYRVGPGQWTLTGLETGIDLTLTGMGVLMTDNQGADMAEALHAGFGWLGWAW